MTLYSFHTCNCFWHVLAVVLIVSKRTGGTLENCPIVYISVILSHGYSGLADWSGVINTLDQSAWGQVTALLMIAWATCWLWLPQRFSLWRWGFLSLPQLVTSALRVHLMIKGRESNINPLEVDQSISRLLSYTMTNKYLGVGTLRLCQYPVSQRPSHAVASLLLSGSHSHQAALTTNFFPLIPSVFMTWSF